MTFANSGTKGATAQKGVAQGSTQHFYIGTSVHDTIVSASALTKSTTYNNFNLSHVSWEEPEDPFLPFTEDQQPDPEVTQAPTASEPMAPAATKSEQDSYLPYTGFGTLLSWEQRQ